MNRRVVTAETEEGRRAIQGVMAASYPADPDRVPAAWARALLADEVPVSFIIVTPDDELPFPRGAMRTAFVHDTATREDRRGEGHFRALLEHTCSSLRAEGVSAITLHGEADLYRRFGFDVYAHHAALLCTTELVEQRLGAGAPLHPVELEVEDRARPDLLMVREAWAGTLPEARDLWQTAAAQARERKKERIMLAFPGSRVWDPHGPFTEAPLTAVALACGGQFSLLGAGAEDSLGNCGDRIKVLDTLRFLQEAVGLLKIDAPALPRGQVQFETEAGAAAVRVSDGGVEVLEHAPGAPIISWPSAAVAQLVLGCHPAGLLAELYETPLREGTADLLDALFPRQWRVSDNDDWIYGK